MKLPKYNKALKLKIIEKFGTQADFAFNAGIDDSIVSRVVKGRKNLGTENKHKWAILLGCKLKDIFLQ